MGVGGSLKDWDMRQHLRQRLVSAIKILVFSLWVSVRSSGRAQRWSGELPITATFHPTTRLLA